MHVVGNKYMTVKTEDFCHAFTCQHRLWQKSLLM